MIGLIGLLFLRCWFAWGFRHQCVAILNIGISNASTFVSIRRALPPQIPLHHSIHQECPLVSFICLDNRCYRLLVGGCLYFSSNSWYSSPRDGFEMVNNHFVDDSHLLVRAEKVSVDGALACLDTFCSASGDIVNAHKTDFWLVGLDEIGSLLLGLIFYLGLLLDIWGFPLKLVCCQLPCGIGFF